MPISLRREGLARARSLERMKEGGSEGGRKGNGMKMAIHRNECENEELNKRGRNDDDDEGGLEGEIKVTRARSSSVLVVGIIHDNAASSTPFFVGAKWQSEREREREGGKEGREGGMRGEGRGEMSSGSEMRKVVDSADKWRS